jgi:hypothetical protein
MKMINHEAKGMDQQVSRVNDFSKIVQKTLPFKIVDESCRSVNAMRHDMVRCVWIFDSYRACQLSTSTCV